MRTFHNWNEDWQQLSKGVGPRGDAVLEERLKKKFLGIKLMNKEKLLWIHLVEVKKKMGKESILPYCYQQAL